MGVLFESLSDRQKYMVEARLRANEDPELAVMPIRQIARLGLDWITKPERYAIQNFIKTKYSIAVGHIGYDSEWNIDTMPTVDYGAVNLAGATTLRSAFFTYPLINPAHAIGSLDPEPFELSTLAAVSGNRQIGTSVQAIALLLGCYAIHISSGGAVYQPAGTTFALNAISANGATGGAVDNLIAAFNLATATNFVDSLTINAPATRQISIDGRAAPTTIAALFNGDTVFAALVTAGALNVQGNVLTVELEVA